MSSLNERPLKRKAEITGEINSKLLNSFSRVLMAATLPVEAPKEDETSAQTAEEGLTFCQKFRLGWAVCSGFVSSMIYGRAVPKTIYQAKVFI